MTEWVKNGRVLFAAALVLALARNALTLLGDAASPLFEQLGRAPFLITAALRVAALVFLVVAARPWARVLLPVDVLFLVVDLAVPQLEQRFGRFPPAAWMVWNAIDVLVLIGIAFAIRGRAVAPWVWGAGVLRALSGPLAGFVALQRSLSIDARMLAMRVAYALPSTLLHAALLIAVLQPTEAAVDPGAAPTPVATGRKDLVVGALWLGGGLVATLVSLQTPLGGRSVMFTGAIAYGLVKLIRGATAR